MAHKYAPSSSLMIFPTSHHTLLSGCNIMVGMSGGVDSSVTAYLLKQAGYTVTGVFMKNWEEDEEGYCTAKVDLADAEAVCDQLNINFKVVNFSESYWQKVFVRFLHEYRLGNTPNPDILCNQEIKFKVFLEYAIQQGADSIATGHYAQLRKTADTCYLCKSIDTHKDQSYFLYTLTEAQLAKTLFPIGHLTKETVRTLAKKINLPTHAKKDSTGICFIGKRKFRPFLKDYLPLSPGLIESIEGEVLGQHDGLAYYTIGQRQGLQIGGMRGKVDLPWYVVKKELTRNRLIVVQGNQHPALLTQSVFAQQVHWINTPPMHFPFACQAKTRYRQADQACLVEEVFTEQSYRITFSVPQRAVTAGQSIVFYQNELCLGGGIIVN